MEIAKKIISICVVFIFIFYLIIYTTELSTSDAQKKSKILVVGCMMGGDYWDTLRLGANAACEEDPSIEIKYLAPKDEVDIQAQIDIINDVLDKDVNAIVVAPNDYERLSKVIEKAYFKRIPIIVINSGVSTDKIVSYIAADGVEEGKKAADMLVSILGKNFKVGVLSSIGSIDASREKGISELFSQYKDIKIVSKEYCLSDIERAKAMTKKMISENSDISAIIALNSAAAEGAAESLKVLNLEGTIKVIAFNSTQKEIDYLEKGIITALVIHDPYTMGYLGVRYAVDSINKKNVPKTFTIESKIIDGTNMYFQENEKLLFPVVR